MRNRTLVVLLLAIACGGIAGYSAWQLLQRQPAQVQTDEPTSRMQVVVARHDLPTGQLLGEEDVRLVDWPSDAVPAGYARTVADVVGRGLMQNVLANEPLLESKMAGRGEGGGLPIAIPVGMRAYTIRVDEATGVAGFIAPGTHVDVLVSMNTPGRSNDPVTRIVVQNVLVRSRGQAFQDDEEGNPMVVPTITLVMEPEQLERVAAIAMNQRFGLALRNMTDVKEVRTPGVRMSSILNPPGSGRPASARTAPRVAPPLTTEDGQRVIEIFRGGKRALIRF